MLTVRGLNAYYGKSHILQGVNLDVAAGEVVSLIGRDAVHLVQRRSHKAAVGYHDQRLRLGLG